MSVAKCPDFSKCQQRKSTCLRTITTKEHLHIASFYANITFQRIKSKINEYKSFRYNIF